MIKLLKKILKIKHPKIFSSLKDYLYFRENIAIIKDLMLEKNFFSNRDYKNPLNNFGYKCFSQSDEDGITIEILRRIGIVKNGTFAEYGVGDGMENNTLILLSLDFKGFWVGGENLLYKHNKSNKLLYKKTWITVDNIISITNSSMKIMEIPELDVLSIDLDGNDYFFIKELLENEIRPKLFIAEYNSKFPPPVSFCIKYDKNHVWSNDYFGASLTKLTELFSAHGYTLICCNAATGSNSFFIRDDLKSKFSDVPSNIMDIYFPPRYNLLRKYGHSQSIKTIMNIIS
jgi:hypothetical protein